MRIVAPLAFALLVGACGSSDDLAGQAAGAGGSDSAGAGGAGGDVAGQASGGGQPAVGDAGAAGALSDLLEVCVPGTTIACLGPGACQGAQACDGDGAAYGACDCGEGPGGAGGAAGTGCAYNSSNTGCSSGCSLDNGIRLELCRIKDATSTAAVLCPDDLRGFDNCDAPTPTSSDITPETSYTYCCRL